MSSESDPRVRGAHGVGEELALTDGGVQLDLAPFEIVTIALRLGARKS